MCCFVVFFSFWPSLKIKLFSVKKIQFFCNRKRPPFFLPVQLLMSRSLCQRCAVMSGAEWFCLLPAGLVVPQWYHGWAKGILQPSAHRALAGSWSDKTPSFPLLRDYWDTEFFLGANGSSSRSMPCISLCMEELSCHLGPRAQHDTMSQHYSNHTGLVSTASVWIINAELRVLETLQQWYQWLFRVGDIGGVVFNLFLAHMSLLFSVVVEIASLWTILQQQTSKVSELETNCIVDYFFFQIFIPQEMKHVFYCFLSQGPGAVITKLPTQYGAVCPRSTPFSPISPSNITPFPPALSLTVLR